MLDSTLSAEPSSQTKKVISEVSTHSDERFRSKHHKLGGLILLVTEECNLRCEYCYIQKIPKHMKVEVVDNTLEFFFRNSHDLEEPLSICFFGGEPLLVPELIEYACETSKSRAKKEGRKVVFSMTSNATLVDESRAELIRKYDISTTLSLDGIGDSHDKYRRTVGGKGSFKLIEKNLERLIALPGVKIRLTVGPDTAARLTDSVRWLFEHGFKNVSLSPVYEGDWNLECLSALLDSYESLYKLQQEYGNKAAIGNLRQNEERLKSSSEQGYGCGAARHMVAVDTDGVLYPCHRYVGYFKDGKRQQIGNVFEGYDIPAREFYIAANHISTHTGCGLGLFEEEVKDEEKSCQGCAVNSVCGSGCMAVNENMTGDPREPHAINRLFAQITAAVHLNQRALLINDDEDFVSKECGIS